MKAVLFDLDETLLDRSGSLTRFCYWQGSHVLNVDDIDRFVQRFLELDDNGTVWKDRVYRALKIEFSLNQTTEELVDQYLMQFRQFCQPRPGALDAVHQLASSGYKLGLVSNGKSPFQERNFSSLGVDNLFDAVIVSEAVGSRKPESTIFHAACQALSVSPEECVFVGDNPVADIQGAAAVGMYTVFVPTTLYGDSCPNAHAVCDDYHDLSSIILSI